jgi:hypothetical protein
MADSLPDPSTLFQDLENALKDFKKFLADNTAILLPVVQALKPIVPQLGTLLNNLIALMTQLIDAIDKFNLGSIPHLDELAKFTTLVKAILTAAEALLPQQKPAIENVLQQAEVVIGLPAFTPQLKADIIQLLKDIKDNLTTLNS